MLPGLLSQEEIPIAFIPISLFRGLKRCEALCHHRCALDLKNPWSVSECSVRAQLLLCFGSSPSLEVHLGTILLPELLPPWECKDKPYQGWFFVFVFF